MVAGTKQMISFLMLIAAIYYLFHGNMVWAAIMVILSILMRRGNKKKKLAKMVATAEGWSEKLLNRKALKRGYPFPGRGIEYINALKLEQAKAMTCPAAPPGSVLNGPLSVPLSVAELQLEQAAAEFEQADKAKPPPAPPAAPAKPKPVKPKIQVSRPKEDWYWWN
jgi:hypothetical protein